MPAKTAFYDCEELRLGGKGKDKHNAPGEEVTEDGNKEEGLRDNFAEKLLLSSPPPKSIAPPVMRSVRMPGAAENASTSTLGLNDDGEGEHERGEVFGKRVQFSSEGFRSAGCGIS